MIQALIGRAIIRDKNFTLGYFLELLGEIETLFLLLFFQRNLFIQSFMSMNKTIDLNKVHVVSANERYQEN